MEPISIPWWVSVLTSAVTGVVTMAIGALEVSRRKKLGQQAAIREGGSIILRQGRTMRYLLPGVFVFFCTFVGLMVYWFNIWADSGPVMQGFAAVTLLFVALLWPPVCAHVWMYRMEVSEQGILVGGLLPARLIYYNAIIEIKEKDAEFLLRLAGGGRVVLSKDMQGWGEALALIRKHTSTQRRA